MPIAVDTVSLFVLASAALAVAPGPDNLFVVTQSALNGRIAGLLVTLGLCTGLLVHTTAVALGIAVIFATSAVAFTILKLVGAAYLLYLAWRAFRAGRASVCVAPGQAASKRNLYLRGVIMNVTNPKVAIFFLAFLPQFTDPAVAAPVTLQVLTLGALFIGVTFLVFGSIAWFAGLIGEKLTESVSAQRTLNRVAGLVFVGLAAKLVLFRN